MAPKGAEASLSGATSGLVLFKVRFRILFKGEVGVSVFSGPDVAEFQSLKQRMWSQKSALMLEFQNYAVIKTVLRRTTLHSPSKQQMKESSGGRGWTRKSMPQLGMWPVKRLVIKDVCILHAKELYHTEGFLKATLCSRDGRLESEIWGRETCLTSWWLGVHDLRPMTSKDLT